MVDMEIREHDLRECHTLYPAADPQELLEYSLKASIEIFEFTSEDGEVIAQGGVAEMSTRVGYTVWLVGSPLMDSPKNHRKVLKEGRVLLKELLKTYYRLSNFCSADSGQLKSMEALGFTVFETGRDDMRFIQCVL